MLNSSAVRQQETETTVQVEASAWILNFGDGIYASTAEVEMCHLVDMPKLLPMTQQKPYCRYALAWQGEAIPIIELPIMLKDEPSRQGKMSVVAIMRFWDEARQELRYGALNLADIPTRTLVQNEMECALPDTNLHWEQVAIACFTFAGRAVPVLDLQQVFANVDTVQFKQEV